MVVVLSSNDHCLNVLKLTFQKSNLCNLWNSWICPSVARDFPASRRQLKHTYYPNLAAKFMPKRLSMHVEYFCCARDVALRYSRHWVIYRRSNSRRSSRKSAVNGTFTPSLSPSPPRPLHL